MKKWLLLMLMSACLLVGCTETKDAETRETRIIINPEIIAAIDGVAEVGSAAVAVAGPLSLYWPPAAGIAGIIAGVVGAWRNMKPKLKKLEENLDYHSERSVQFYGITAAMVYAIKEFRESNPDDWEKLGAQLSKVIGPEAENVIRALRGLPERV